ncbi:hypothetical protein [Bacillus sp. ISL-55]|uniref:hypothetical protein n=1 Tax=Bacillus sp. ISL-55 TaxID=2819134 RepID=UPI001BE8B542|nr:hypothetical protein [Bacillus sp. ISL-55]MBT2692136.1 hypothetical protein [Bacillus sp. ISL-55]
MHKKEKKGKSRVFALPQNAQEREKGSKQGCCTAPKCARKRKRVKAERLHYPKMHKKEKKGKSRVSALPENTQEREKR